LRRWRFQKMKGQERVETFFLWRGYFEGALILLGLFLAVLYPDD